jgi:hypothetical protein
MHKPMLLEDAGTLNDKKSAFKDQGPLYIPVIEDLSEQIHTREPVESFMLSGSDTM